MNKLIWIAGLALSAQLAYAADEPKAYQYGDKLDIAFDKAGIKKIVARFVRSADDADDVPF